MYVYKKTVDGIDIYFVYSSDKNDTGLFLVGVIDLESTDNSVIAEEVYSRFIAMDKSGPCSIAVMI